MNDLTLNHNKATLTIDESEGGIVIRISECIKPGAPIGTISTTMPADTRVYANAQIWLDQRGIARLYAFLRDVMPDHDEGLNGEEIY